MSRETAAGLAVLVAAAVLGPYAAPARAVSKNYPWDRKTRFVPDNQVPGSFVNLGQTGARAKLDAKSLEVRYVFKGTPADGTLEVGDVIVGAGGRDFTREHKFGWGYRNCGGEGPLMDLGEAIDRCEGADGKLSLHVVRGGKKRNVVLQLRPIGSFSPTYPRKCRKTNLLFREMCAYLAKRQRPDGSWQGHGVVSAAAALVLLGSGDPQYAANVRRAAEQQAKIRAYERGLHNWRLTYSGIFLAEYYLATADRRVIPALERINWGMVRNLSPNGSTQHLKVGDVDWGGYSELSVMSGLMMTAWGLIDRCGVDVRRERLDAVHRFLALVTCPNGYVCYNRREFTDLGGMNVADFGRTGASVMGHWLCNRSGEYDRYIARSAGYIGDYHKWFPDTHGSPGVGMMWSALAAAAANPPGFRRLMDYHRWWFALAWCGDGSYVAQPTRSGSVGADYWSLPRDWMTATVGLIFAVKERKLRICGGRLRVLGLDAAALTPRLRRAFEQVEAGRFAKAAALLDKALADKRATAAEKRDAARLKRYVLDLAERRADELAALDRAGDVYRLLRTLLGAKVRFAGIESFDRRVAPLAEALADPSRTALASVGQEYHALQAAQRHPLRLDSVRRLETFAARHEGTPYAGAAREEAQRLWQIGIYLMPTAEDGIQIWRHTTTKPADDWAKPGFDDSKWPKGPAGFGHRPTVQGVVRTPWKTSDIWLRRTVRLEEVPPVVLLCLYNDDSVEVFVNGVAAVELDKKKHVYTPIRLSTKARAALRVGENVLAVHCKNDGGGQYIDLGVIGKRMPKR